MKRIAVYCGSAKGSDPAYEAAAKQLVQVMHAQGIGLVYGGGDVGLMGIIADEMMALGGEVIGVIPRKLFEKEVAHDNITKLYIVESMHERKAKMLELADAVIAMPGGIGTMDELFETFTWSQLGYHFLPCGVLNVNGYYDMLRGFLQQMVDHRFLKQDHKNMLVFDTEATGLLEKLRAFEYPAHIPLL